ncbi:hypothetical protein B0T25DRAFT_623422 [Lasiosphaeria hispida]|uniref:Uncharacterized protein n=1 Tax=Lasiosphaeria hispida TaxID=260671 RepID=A0AAJ0HIS8_9PEZI|nr:hypothetical protein B0T25DRAFT_623422 [Lasiosphaeria hispida]
MSGARPPFLYASVQDDKDERFPTKPFDPKAVTRASYDAKVPKPKSKGPLVSINRHPDAHVVLGPRSSSTGMGRRTKAWIKSMRSVQLLLRVLELLAAVGLLIVMIMINNIDSLTGWVIRITLGVALLHTTYGMYHLSKPASGRTPGSSAAYHVFASISDLCVLPLYGYGALAARNDGEQWGTLLPDKEAIKGLVPAAQYGLITAAGFHLLSLSISLYLGVMFRRISMMPPDMNPLEGHLTARAHKRNKSSVATGSTYTVNDKRLDTPLDNHPATRPPSVPFMHTRQGSEISVNKRDSRMDLPSRQYQIAPSNSPRNSLTPQDAKRMSAPPRSPRDSYTEVSLSETRSRPTSSYSRPSTGTVSSHRVESVEAAQTAQPRAAKFTEAWYASESLINRTKQRTRALNQMNTADKRRTYEALDQRYNAHDSDSENEHKDDYRNPRGPARRPRPTSENDAMDLGAMPDALHPNPLRSNPAAVVEPPRRPKTPFSRVRNSVLSAISLNRVSGSYDIADERAGVGADEWDQPRNRDSSIQMDHDFYSKPYGELRPATPPVIIGGNRQVSSGIDYDMGAGVGSSQFGRRHVSGKIAEEGRAGGRGRFSYEPLDED